MQHVNENRKAWTQRSNPNSSSFKLKITILSLLIFFFLLFHSWKIDFSCLCLLKCPHLQLTACFNLCIHSSIPPSKPCQTGTWEPLSHTHRWSYQVSEIFSLLFYDQKMARQLLPWITGAQIMLRRLLQQPEAVRTKPISHIFAEDHLRAASIPEEDASGACAPPTAPEKTAE